MSPILTHLHMCTAPPASPHWRTLMLGVPLTLNWITRRYLQMKRDKMAARETQGQL